MSNYRFDFNQGDATLEDMKRITTRINSALRQMEQNVEKTLANWTGPAQIQYGISKAEWTKAANDMVVYFELARTTLWKISDNYGTTEKRHEMLWNDVRGG